MLMDLSVKLNQCKMETGTRSSFHSFIIEKSETKISAKASDVSTDHKSELHKLRRKIEFHPDLIAAKMRAFSLTAPHKFVRLSHTACKFLLRSENL